MRSWLMVATSGFGVVVRNAYNSNSTFGPSFFTGPLYRRQMPGNAKAGRGELGHTSVGLYLDELFAGLRGYRFAGLTKGLDVELDRFADVGQGLVPRVPLTVAARKRGNADRVAAVGFLFQNDRIALSPESLTSRFLVPVDGQLRRSS